MKELSSLDAHFERQSLGAQAPTAIYHSATYSFPDAKGHFGMYGGTFVSETLTHALNELKDAYAKYQHDPEFLEEFR
jgi:tryptophan synthase beta chain